MSSPIDTRGGSLERPTTASKRKRSAKASSREPSTKRARGQTRETASATPAANARAATYESLAEDLDDENDNTVGPEELRDRDAEQIYKDRKDALAILFNEHFTDEQKERFEDFRAAGFTKSQMKRLINYCLSQSVTPNIVTAFNGLSKIFVGEIVEAARRVQSEAGRSGPLLPDDIREAHRLWLRSTNAPGSRRKKLFIR